jgi:hypothetical protein
MVGAFTRALVAQTVKKARDIGDAWLGLCSTKKKAGEALVPWLGLWLLCEEESQRQRETVKLNSVIFQQCKIMFRATTEKPHLSLR